MKLDPKKKIAAEFHSSYGYIRDTIERNRDGILRLAILSDLKVSAAKLSETGGTVRSTARFDVRVAHSIDAVDAQAEKARLKKEIESLEKAILRKRISSATKHFVAERRKRSFSGWKRRWQNSVLNSKSFARRLRDISRV